jgi:hypothetical protein
MSFMGRSGIIRFFHKPMSGLRRCLRCSTFHKKTCWQKTSWFWTLKLVFMFGSVSTLAQMQNSRHSALGRYLLLNPWIPTRSLIIFTSFSYFSAGKIYWSHVSECMIKLKISKQNHIRIQVIMGIEVINWHILLGIQILCLLLNICKNLKLQKVVYSKSASCLVAMVLNVGVHCWGCYIRWLESTSPYYQDTWRTWTGLLHKFFLVGWEEGCCKCNDLVLRMRDFFCSELRNAGTIDITDSLTVHSQIMLEQFDLSCISC